MKADFILCILLASILFFPSSLLAGELAGGDPAGTSKPNPVIPGTGKRQPVPCKGNPYGRSCPGKPPKSASCKYKRNCPPNSSP